EIGYNGGIPVDADFDLVREQRLEIHAAGLAVLQVLRPVLDGAARAMMSEVLMQDALQERGIRLDDGRIEVLDELRQLAFVAGQVSGLRALERNEDIPGPPLGLERGGPALVQVRCVVAGRQRVAVQGIDSLPHLPLEGSFRMLEVKGRRL